LKVKGLFENIKKLRKAISNLKYRFEVWWNKCPLYDVCEFKEDDWFHSFYCLTGRYEECIIYENTRSYYGDDP